MGGPDVHGVWEVHRRVSSVAAVWWQCRGREGAGWSERGVEGKEAESGVHGSDWGGGDLQKGLNDSFGFGRGLGGQKVDRAFEISNVSSLETLGKSTRRPSLCHSCIGTAKKESPKPAHSEIIR